MARLIKESNNMIISCKVVTHFKDGTSVAKNISVGDIVEGLRFVRDEEIVTVTGKVTRINCRIDEVTRVNLTQPEDYFSKDVKVRSITVDCSEQYESNVVDVPAMEIIEDEGILDVAMVTVESAVRETMKMQYSDGNIVDQDLEIGDVIKDCVILAGPGIPDITGIFKLVAWNYSISKNYPVINGIYIKDLDSGKVRSVLFKSFVEFEEVDSADVTDPTSLVAISEALNASEDGVVYASLGVDVTIPKREDGRITTTMINAGKTLNLDLNGHTINTEAYAFYVNGGELNISDTTNGGKIECTRAGAAYPAIFIGADGVCNMSGGIIDTTNVDTSETYNWLYGAVCSGNGVFNMTGGEMIIGGAAGISITNGTAAGEGAKFTIGGTSKIKSVECAAIYLADNKSVEVKDYAVIDGGIVLRMGDLTIKDNAVVYGHKEGDAIVPLGIQVCTSGVEAAKAPILALTGIYGSDLGNDLNINIAKTATVVGYIDDTIDIATINTKFDQIVNVNIENSNSLRGGSWNIYDHDQLAEMAAAEGRTLAAETNTTILTIKQDGAVVYPVVNEGE